MGNLLLDFMTEYWPDTELKRYTEIMEVLTGVNEEYASNMDTYFSLLSEGETDLETITDDIKGRIQNMLVEVLRNLGVFVSEEYPLDNYTLLQIYLELIGIEQNEQAVNCIGILNDKEIPVADAFFEVIQLIGGNVVDEDSFHKHIDRISEYTRDKLVSYLLNQRHMDVDVKVDEDVFDRMTAANRIKQFCKVLNDGSFLVIDLIKNGVNMGMLFKDYMSIYGSDILELDFKDQAYNLYLLGLISKDGAEGPAELVERHLSNYVFDLGTQDHLIRAVRDIQIKTR